MFQTVRRRSVSLMLSLCGISYAQTWHKLPDGVSLTIGRRIERLQIFDPQIVRVTLRDLGAPEGMTSLSVIERPQPTRFSLAQSGGRLRLRTSRLVADVDVKTGAIRFEDASGRTLLQELDSPKSFIKDSFALPLDEDLYGLGQHQQGFMSYRGARVTLEQHNMEVAIPFLLSSHGYGLLWDNPASTTVDVDGPSPTEIIPTSMLSSEDGQPGLTAEYFEGKSFTGNSLRRTDSGVDFVWTDKKPMGLGPYNYCVRWTGNILAPQSGAYSFETDADDGARLFIDDKPVIDDWEVHPTKSDVASVSLTAGAHRIRLEYFQGGGGAEVHLRWAKPQPPHRPRVVWQSEVGDHLDYYVIVGPNPSEVIPAYRRLTGAAPLPGKWAFGYWQSKERYKTQQEWLDVAREYRARKEPIDNLVQDWFYWDPGVWGSNYFDPKRYPDPVDALRTMHDQFHMHMMISVWGKFLEAKPEDPTGGNYRTMLSHGYLYPRLGGYYDAFNPSARNTYWDLVHRQIFDKGFDAWWLDASEPEVDMKAFRKTETAIGPASRVLNAWPLEHTGGVYRGQRHVTNDKRVFILTRSAYAGQQRNAAATWSGDITASWEVYRNQIPAGLNFCLSGIPYWTTDIGAFVVPSYTYPGGSSNPDYRELFTRWFQFGAFCPIFRAHGTNTPRELWRFGPDERVLAAYDRLRYRLLPYIYSVAADVTQRGDTLMRALVLDFPKDVVARRLRDEFMFGPAFLIAPVVEPNAKSRHVYLPAGANWFDFWTGHEYAGGRSVDVPTPISIMPIFVREGSRVPMGPEVQYAMQPTKAPIEVRVYGKTGPKFSLYEDAGDGYGYEKGQFVRENLSADAVRSRTGTYPGIPKRESFEFVDVRPGHGVGIEPTPHPDRRFTLNVR